MNAIEERKFPYWLKKRVVLSERFNRTRNALKECAIATVCENSLCPNSGECFSKGSVSFLILGKVCTRSCGYCSSEKGSPLGVGPGEPARIVEAVKKIGLRYAVVTSVTRDDLADGGASQFAAVIRALRDEFNDDIKIEVLVPDFGGNRDSIKTVLEAGPDIFGHNIETVERLYARVRPRADYNRSLGLLRTAKDIDEGKITKSSLMVGLGETDKEIADCMRDLRAARCDLLALGQYLSPSTECLPVERFATPGEFDRYREVAESLGFARVAAAPFVRSSYRAEEAYDAYKDGGGR